MSKRGLQQKCAYHNNQLITNFCKCDQCLLPVCQTCIKLHTDQHKLSKTVPHFEEINKVQEEMQRTYGKLQAYIQQIRLELLDVQNNRKKAELQMKKKLVQHRNKLVKQFEKMVQELQNDIIRQIVKEDQIFIKEIQGIDNQLTKVNSEIQKNRDTNPQQALKNIIIFFAKNQEEKYSKICDNIKELSEQLNKKNYVVTVEEQQLKSIRRAVANYMRLQVTNS